MKRVLAVIALASLAGCEMASDYAETPAPTIVSTAPTGVSRFADVTVAVVYTDNAQKAEQFNSAWGGSLLSSRINSVLSGRFAGVVQAVNAASASKAGAHLIAVVDARATYSMGLLDTGTAEINVDFKTLDDALIERISGHGQDVRFAGPVAPAVEAALVSFAGNLDGASRLWTEASRIAAAGTPAKAVAAAPAAPVQAAAPRARFSSIPIAAKFPKGAPRPDDVAVIIGNADYSKLGKDIPDVVPAYADAEGFKRYVMDAQGLREGNIIDLRDATGSQMVRVFGSATNPRGQLYDWVKAGRSRVFVYYSGHGAPAAQGGSPYLVPVDSDAARIDLNGYPLKLLYDNLGKLPAEQVSVFLEACFSGASQAGSVIANASPVFTKVQSPDAPAKVAVFAAGAADQIASWETDKSHGLFTKYFLLGQSGEADKSPYGNADGRVTLEELDRYLKDTLTYYARRYYGRDQTAQITGVRP